MTKGPRQETMEYILDNGFRIICAPSTSEVVYCGIAVDAGTRDERNEESGIAHFTEHLSFKGTCRRTARQIINSMESVGGDLNAYTGKEETVYYSAFLRRHLPRAIDTLLDIVMCSVYPQREMDKEVEVVVDEIESYNDQPGELIYDEFEELLFGTHPLGRNILGKADVLRTMKSADIQAFTRRMYTPDRMVLYVYGNVNPAEVLRLVDRCMDRISWQPATEGVVIGRQTPILGEQDVTVRGNVVVRTKGTHQAHVMMGTVGFGGSDPRHLHLYLLNNILGGPGMGSRLNLSLRERRGLVYTVESASVAYTDCGVWSVYFGCDGHDVERCMRLVRSELTRLADAPMTQRTLDAARRQLKGQIGVAYDNGENVALGMAKRYLHYGTTQSMQQLFDRLDSLTPQALQATASEVFDPSRLTTLIYS